MFSFPTSKVINVREATDDSVQSKQSIPLHQTPDSPALGSLGILDLLRGSCIQFAGVDGTLAVARG